MDFGPKKHTSLTEVLGGTPAHTIMGKCTQLFQNPTFYLSLDNCHHDRLHPLKIELERVPTPKY